MNAKLKRRLEQFEQDIRVERSSLIGRIRGAALGTLSKEDLMHLETSLKRGVPLVECTPEERLAVERYEAAAEAAALKIAGRSFSQLTGGEARN